MHFDGRYNRHYRPSLIYSVHGFFYVPVLTKTFLNFISRNSVVCFRKSANLIGSPTVSYSLIEHDLARCSQVIFLFIFGLKVRKIVSFGLKKKIDYSPSFSMSEIVNSAAPRSLFAHRKLGLVVYLIVN